MFHYQYLLQKGLHAFVMGVIVSATAVASAQSGSASAPPVPSVLDNLAVAGTIPPPPPPPTSSMEACARKCSDLAGASLTDLANCPFKSSIPECAGLTQNEKIALENICQTCGDRGADEASGAAGKKPKGTSPGKGTPPKVKKFTPQQICESDRQNSVWVDDPPHCYSLKDVFAELKALKERQATASPDNATGLKVEMLDLEAKLEKLQQSLCRRLKDKPELDNDVDALCQEAGHNIVSALYTSKTALNNAGLAQSSAQRAHVRANEAVAASGPDWKTHLWLSLAVPVQIVKDLKGRLPASIGAQVSWLPNATDDVRMLFMVGGGKGIGPEKTWAVWGGAGMAGALGTEHLVLRGFLLGEHHFEEGGVTFVGPGMGLTYIANLPANPHLGVRGALGDASAKDGEKRRHWITSVVALEAGLSF